MQMKKATLGNESHENPYVSPATIGHRLEGAVRSFQVGREEINTIFVETSLWTGLRTHSTNAAGDATPVQRGPCRLEVGERERHEVVIEVDKTARVNALVDGELVECNLFPRSRAVIMVLVALFSVVVCVIAYLLSSMIFNA